MDCGKHWLAASITLLLACGGDSATNPESQTALEGFDLVWSDEFDYTGLPAGDKWSYDRGGHGWGNNELQFYTAGDPDNARVEDGVLIIEARREQVENNNYTSARLVTRGRADWIYGRFEAKAKLPAGRGTWPAIWMLPTLSTYGNGGWPDNGEIDIMEHVGFDPGVVHGTVHTRAYNHLRNTQRGGSMLVRNATTAFHVYAIEWGPEKIEFFIDNMNYFTFPNENEGWEKWPFDKPFHLILNIAVGGNWGGAQGVDASIFPVRMEIDYVRVYERHEQ